MPLTLRYWVHGLAPIARVLAGRRDRERELLRGVAELLLGLVQLVALVRVDRRPGVVKKHQSASNWKPVDTAGCCTVSAIASASEGVP